MYHVHDKINYVAAKVSPLFQCHLACRIYATVSCCALICTAYPQLSPPNTLPMKWERVLLPRSYSQWDDPDRDGDPRDSHVRRPKSGRNYYTLTSTEVQGKYGPSYSKDRWSYNDSTGEHHMWANASDLPPISGCGTRSETDRRLMEWTNTEKNASGRTYKYRQIQFEIKLYAPTHYWSIFQIKKQARRAKMHLMLVGTQKNNGSLCSGPGWSLKSGMYGLASKGVWTQVNIVFDARDTTARSYVAVDGIVGTKANSWTKGIPGGGDMDKPHNCSFGVYVQACHTRDWGPPSSKGEARFRNVKFWKSVSNEPPIVSIVSPANDTTCTGPATIHLLARSKDADDRISKVEFYHGTALIRTEYYHPYTYTLTNVQAGTYTIIAKAYDVKGLSATSEPVTITVKNAPIVSRPSSLNSKADLNGALNSRLKSPLLKEVICAFLR